MHPVLEVNNLVREFARNIPVLNGVTFTMQREEVVALLGANGAGKTTLIRIILGLLFPDRGSVRVFGMSPTEKPVEVKRRIGYVGDRQSLPTKANIPELIALHRKLFPTWDATLERTLLDRFGLAGNDQALARLSKGQAQKAALLLAVCHRPELLLLDEPAEGLDPVARRDFLETSIQLLNSEGSAILFSSHQMSDVERLGGRALLLDRGVIQLDHPLDSLREEHTLAVFARRDVGDRALIEQLPGFLRARKVNADWHVLLRGAPSAVSPLVHRAIATTAVHCSTLPLEELFIEMVSASRKDAA